MGYRCYFKGQTRENKIKDELCLGKCYGYNEDSDGLMLGYLDIMQTAAYKEYRSDETVLTVREYTDYEIIDLCFTARGSIDMHILTEDFLSFLDHYYKDYNSVWGEEYPEKSKQAISEYLQDCVSVFVEWI